LKPSVLNNLPHLWPGSRQSQPAEEKKRQSNTVKRGEKNKRAFGNEIGETMVNTLWFSQGKEGGAFNRSRCPSAIHALFIT